LSYDFFKEFLDNSPVLDDRYKILQTIGEGRYAKVKLAINLEDREKYAIKIMREDQVNSISKLEGFLNEVKILSSVYHKHIVEMVYVNLRGEYKKPNGKIVKVVYYVMRFAEYGELFEILQKTTSFSERLARYYFKQLIESVEYLHNTCIGHRDIKTENILIDHNFNLKLADFGCVCKSRDQNLQRIGFSNQQAIGSPEYNAPEITNNTLPGEYYAENADIFASACALFVMVLQSIPFNNSLFSDPYYSRLCKKDTSKFWKIFDTENKLTSEFRDLIERMMEPNPYKRITIDGIKKHPWYLGPLPSFEEVSAEMRKRGEIILAQNQEKFRDYHMQKLRKKTNGTRTSPTSKSRDALDFEIENLTQMMQPTMVEINTRLRREFEERNIYHGKKEKQSEQSHGKNLTKSRRRSSEELHKQKEEIAQYEGHSGSDDEPQMFLTEPCDEGSKPTHRKSPPLRKNSSKEDRIRIRRSGSDD